MMKCKRLLSVMMLLVLVIGACGALAVPVAASEVSDTDLYIDFMNNEGYKAKVEEAKMNPADKYAILDIDGNGVFELIVFSANSINFCNFDIYTIDNGVVYVGSLQGWRTLNYSAKHKALNYNPYMVSTQHSSSVYVTITDGALVPLYKAGFTISMETFKPEYYCEYYDSTGNTVLTESLSEEDYTEFNADTEGIAWKKIGFLYRLGDVNMDATVNIKDATAIQKHIANLIMLTDEGLALADTDGSGNVNIKDATAIQKHIAGIDTGLPVATPVTL